MSTLMETGSLDAPLTIAGRALRSRLMVGTGKYRTNAEMVDAIDASGAEVVTVAVRRVDLDRTKEEGILHHLDPGRHLLLPNTAGCYTATDAIRYARLARAAGFTDWVKLEVIGDPETLLPDVEATLAAARELVADGFTVLAYTNDDLITALRLEEAHRPVAVVRDFAVRPVVADGDTVALCEVHRPLEELDIGDGLHFSCSLRRRQSSGIRLPCHSCGSIVKRNETAWRGRRTRKRQRRAMVESP